MTRSLAGTNGVPLPEERTYLRVVSETDEEGEARPLAVLWPDGRRFRAELPVSVDAQSTVLKAEIRDLFGPEAMIA